MAKQEASNTMKMPEPDEEFHDGRWQSEETDHHDAPMLHPERDYCEIVENLELLESSDCESDFLNDEGVFDGFLDGIIEGSIDGIIVGN